MLEDRLVPSTVVFFPGGIFGGPPAQPAATTTTVSSSANPSGFFQVVTFTATITGQSFFSGTPTGTVQFAIDGMNTGSPVNVGTTNGVTTATYSTVSLFIGTHTVTASYSGDSNFAASSGSLTQTVNLRYPTFTTITSSQSTSNVGQMVTFTATVTELSPNGAAPTGTVQFVIDGSKAGSPVKLTTTTGVSTATYNTSSLSPGPHIVEAVYLGDSNFTDSVGSLLSLQQVQAANTNMTLTSSSNPSAPGQPVTFTATISLPATVTAIPSGIVEFVIDGIPVSTASLTPAGSSLFTASYTTSSLAVGTHTVTANYSGDLTFPAASATLAGGQMVGTGIPLPGGGGGSGGNVIVSLTPGTDALNITGYNDNDSITLSQGGSGTLQISGNNTLINGSASPVSYPLSSIRGINISLLNGNDSLTLGNFSIPGTLSILTGSGSDAISVGAFTAGTIQISVAGPGASTVAVNNTTAGTINVAAGDNATLLLSGVNNTGPVVLTAGNNAAVSVNGLTTSGDLDITAADHPQAITVQGSSANNLNIVQTGTSGSPTFNLENDTISSDLELTAGGGNNSVVLSHLNVAGRMFVTLGSGTNTVDADHVTALFGTLDGGPGGNNTYVDGGGNSGFSVFDFIGH
jgi:hypothetical protein